MFAMYCRITGGSLAGGSRWRISRVEGWGVGGGLQIRSSRRRSEWRRSAQRVEKRKRKKKKATDGGCCSRRGRIRAADGLALALVLVLVLRCGFLLLLNKNSPAVPVSGRGSGMDFFESSVYKERNACGWG